MVDKETLTGFNIPTLQAFKQAILSATSTEELLISLDEIISKKKELATTSFNARFLVDWMNIDPEYRLLLHRNGIENLHQLREIENLWELEGMTRGGHEQISWARAFFDMTPVENLSPEEESLGNIAKILIKHAEEVGPVGTTGEI